MNELTCRFRQADGYCGCKSTDKHGIAVKCEKACTLFQTVDMQAKSLECAWNRFAELPVYKQTRYINKYYGGKMPWEVSL